MAVGFMQMSFSTSLTQPQGGAVDRLCHNLRARLEFVRELGNFDVGVNLQRKDGRLHSNGKVKKCPNCTKNVQR